MSHTVKDALENTSLSEEEAYFLLMFANQLGYEKAIAKLENKPFRRLRQWFIWFGGWEKPYLSQITRGVPAWELKNDDGKWKEAYPLSLFGGKVTFYGGWWDFKFLKGWIVGGKGASHKLYWSPNGTPGHARAKVLIGK